MSTYREREEHDRRRLPMAERLEPRLLYSADALGPLAPLLDARDPFLPIDDEFARLVAAVEPPATPAAVGAGHVVFVDATVPDAERIAGEVAASGARAVLVGPDEDGLLVISRTLAELEEVAAIHLFAHGTDGAQRLGHATLDIAALDADAPGIARWGDALAEHGDILLYGCDVGTGSVGLRLIGELATLTGADVAASENRTGHAAANGDWALERSSGRIEADTLDDGIVGEDWEHALATIVISNPDDSITTLPEEFDLAALAAWQADDPANNRATLRDALIAARNGDDPARVDRIELAEGVFRLALDGDDDAALTGDLDVEGRVVIVGLGTSGSPTVVDANGLDRAFEVLGTGALTLENLTVTKGFHVGDGGGINVRSGGELILQDVTLLDNESSADGGGVHADDGTTLTVDDSTFEANRTSGGDGGGIHARGAVAIADSVFEDNRAVGGTPADGSRGGGLYTAGDAIVIGSLFENNVARAYGGAIDARGALTLSESVLFGNASDGAAGGARIDGVLTMADTAIGANTASRVAGVEAKGGGTIERSSFVDNEADVDVGALRVEGVAPLVVTNATFASNTAIDGFAGAVHLTGDADATFTNTTFFGNKDDDEAGAIYVQSGVAEIRNSVFVANVSDGGKTDFAGDVRSAGFNAFQYDVSVAQLEGDREGVDAASIALGGITDIGDPLTPSGRFVQGFVPGPGSILINAGGEVDHRQDAAGAPLDQIPDIGAVNVSSDGETIYYINQQGQIVRVGVSLDHPQVILDGIVGPQDISVDIVGGRLYWLEQGNIVSSSRLDGSQSRVETTVAVRASGIAVDAAGRNLLVAHTAPGAGIDRHVIGPAGLGAASAAVSTGIADPIDLVTYPGAAGESARVYWVDRGGVNVLPAVKSAEVEGENEDVIEYTGPLTELQGRFTGISITGDGSRLFWSKESGNDDVAAYVDLIDGARIQEFVISPNLDPIGILHLPIAERVWLTSQINGTVVLFEEDLQSTSVGRAVLGFPVRSDLAATSPVDAPPVFEPDPTASLEVTEGESAPLSVAGLLASDDITRSEDLVWRVESGPAHGSIVLDGNVVDRFTQGDVDAGRVVYEDGPNGETSDTFELLVSDGANDSGLLRVDVEVVPPAEVAPTRGGGTLTLVVDEESEVPITEATITVTDPDTDPADIRFDVLEAGGGDIRVTGQSGQATFFTGAELADGKVSYLHIDGERANETLRLAISDPTSAPYEETIDIVVTLSDDAPTLTTGAASVDQGTPFQLTSAQVLATDVDTADTDLVYTLATPLEDATLQVDGALDASTFTQQELLDGKVFYVHARTNTNEHEHDVELTLTDGSNTLSDNIRVTVSANDELPPNGVEDSLTVSENGVQDRLDSGADSVLSNDDDTQDGVDALTAELVSTVSHGALTFAGDGTFSYAHGGGEVASDTFVYAVTDSSGNRSEDVVVSIDIEPENDAPRTVGTLDAQSAREAEPFELTFDSNTWTDDDPDDTLSLAVSVRPASGVDSLPADPSGPPDTRLPAWLTYDADTLTLSGTPGFEDAGSYVLRVVAIDESGERADELQTTLDVSGTNRDPQIQRLLGGSVDENDPGGLVGTVVVSDPDAGDEVTLAVVGDDRFGIVDRELRLAPGVSLDHEASSSETVVIEASDGESSSRRTFDIVVRDVTDGPDAVDDTVEVREGFSADSLDDGAESVLDNDDTGSGEPRVSLVEGPRHGSLLLNSDGTFLYEHDGGENRADEFRYAVEDASGQRSGATVVIVVSPEDDVPSNLTIDGVTLPENVPGARVGTLSADDELAPDALTFVANDPRFVVEGRELRLADDVSLDFESPEPVEIEISATDPGGQVVSERFSITVLDGNDAPSVAARPTPPDVLVSGATYTVPSGTFVDVDRDTLSFSAATADGGALPDWIAFDERGPSFTIVDTGPDDDPDAPPQAERVTVRLFATDGRGGEVALDIDLRREPPLAPALPEPPPEPPPEVTPEPLPEPEPAAVAQPTPVPTPTPTVVPTVPISQPAPEPVDEATIDEDASRVTETPPVTVQTGPATAGARIQTVDLQSLLAGVHELARPELVELESVASGAFDISPVRVETTDVDTVDLDSLLGEDTDATRRGFDDLAEALEGEREALEERASFAQTLVGSSAGVTSGLSVGYLIWLIRGGTLMGSVLSSLPAWRFVDPLPVLGSLADGADGDDESLESLVQKRGHAPGDEPDPSSPDPE